MKCIRDFKTIVLLLLKFENMRISYYIFECQTLLISTSVQAHRLGRDCDC